MPTRLADLDELVLTCRNEGSRELIREAVLCYKAGAFRAAIVTAWIAVAFDLVEKLRELSLAGDKEAEIQVSHFENIQSKRDMEQALKFERELLTVCREKFEFLTPLESLDLERLSEDRNRCAHPNLIRYGEMYLPSAELVRMHLRSAIEHVLQQQPRVGKAALDQLYRDVQAEYFPTDLEGAKRVLADSPLVRAKKNLIRTFALGITASALKGDMPTKEVSKRLAALRATAEIHREYFLELVKTHFPAVIVKTNDDGLKFLLVFLRWIPELAAAVPDGVSARLKRCIELAPPDDVAIVLRSSLNLAEYRDDGLKRLEGLDADGLARLVRGGWETINPEVITRILTIYAGARNFAIANSMGENIVQPILRFLPKDQIIHLFDIGFKNMQVQGSTVFRDLVTEIKSSGLLTGSEFRREMSKREWDQFIDDPEAPQGEEEQ